MLQKGDICYGFNSGWKTGIYMGEVGHPANSFRVYNVYFVSSGRFKTVFHVCHHDDSREYYFAGRSRRAALVSSLKKEVEADVTER